MIPLHKQIQRLLPIRYKIAYNALQASYNALIYHTLLIPYYIQDKTTTNRLQDTKTTRSCLPRQDKTRSCLQAYAYKDTRTQGHKTRQAQAQEDTRSCLYKTTKLLQAAYLRTYRLPLHIHIISSCFLSIIQL